MFVLGIDPGVSRCGYGCLSGSAADAHLVAVGVITTPPSEPLPQRLSTLDGELRSLLKDLYSQATAAGDVLVVAVERVLFQTNVRTAISVGQASGLALAAAAGLGCEVHEYSPNQVKQAAAGYGSATKDQVQRMVASLLGLTEPPRPPDAADALALALCHLATAPLQARLAASRAASSR